MAFKNILPIAILFLAVAATIVQAIEDSPVHNGMYKVTARIRMYFWLLCICIQDN